jgi:hypothetical protein
LQFSSGNIAHNPAITKEIALLLSHTFEPEAVLLFYFRLLKITRTYDLFIKAFSLSLVVLSKLKAIPGLVDQHSSNELHPIFQLVEFNLPKIVARRLLKSMIF